MRLTDAQDFFQHSAIGQRGPAQLGPILPLAASDDVVNSSQGDTAGA
jgi:hypothetical protein